MPTNADERYVAACELLTVPSWVLAGQCEPAVRALLHQAVLEQRVQTSIALTVDGPHRVEPSLLHRVRRLAQDVQQQPTHVPVGPHIALDRLACAGVFRASSA